MRTFQGVGDEDEVEIWRASLAGDGEAFALLWDRHRDRVHRAALRVAETRTEAEDLGAAARRAGSLTHAPMVRARSGKVEVDDVADALHPPAAG